MKRIVSLVLIVLLTMCIAYAEKDYSYKDEIHELTIGNYTFRIPLDFDGQGFDMVANHLPMFFYPDRIDANAFLRFIINPAVSFTEKDLADSLNSMKDNLMKEYNLTDCAIERVVDFVDTKALIYRFSSETVSEFYAAIYIDVKNEQTITILQVTDKSDNSDIQYDKDFSMLLTLANKNTKGSKSRKEEVESFLKKHIDDYNRYYVNTTINRISVNSNLGTSDSDDFIILIYLNWGTQNGVSNTKKMLEMLSDDMAVVLAAEYSNAAEITLFWEVPYLVQNGTCAKYSYECRNGKAYLTGKMGPLYR